MARVLIIDDDPAVRRTLIRLLRLDGHEPVEAGDGREGLRLASADAPDVVITDVNMPEMDGIEVLQALGRSRPGLGVIVISGGGRIPKEHLLTDASMLGAVEVLPKPLGVESTLAAVRRVLAERPTAAAEEE